MSEREYSSHSGLSRGAIQKARKAGRLVVYGDGSINAAASDLRRGEMTDPDQQRRSVGASSGGDSGFSGPADSSSYLKARTALTVYQAQERQLAIQKKKGTLVDRARAETLVFRLAREARDTWVTWPGRVAALMAAEVAAEVEKQTARPVIIEAAILQRVLETRVRAALYGVIGVDLTQIHGLGPSLALKLVGECGTDLRAWPSAKHFTSWLCLAPGNKISGGKLLSSRTRRSSSRAAAL